jgi:imidazolonepropionase-like amidohydrolase
MPQEEFTVNKLIDTLAYYAQVPADEIARWIALPPEAIYQDTAYRALVAQLDASELDRTADYTRQAYDAGLTPIKERYNLQDTIMSGYTLSNWVLGYLMNREMIPQLLDQHATIPPDVIRAILPELLDLLEDIPEGREEWQRALVALTIPLMVSR